MGVKRYRSKPVEIEAMRFGPGQDAANDAYIWAADHVGRYDCTADEVPMKGVSIDPADGIMVISTLEGEMKARLGDWIIKGTRGEFYPCKPDVFETKYEEVS